MKVFARACGIAAVLLASATAAKEPVYSGKDAGCLVYSVGTAVMGMKFVFPYKRVATEDSRAVNDWAGRIEPRVGGAVYLKIKEPDFSGEETGHVVVRCLPPGRYEVGSFKFGGFVPGVAAFTYSAGKPFSLPFTVRSGEATYIGSFIRAPSLGTPLGKTLGAKGYFVIADRASRDLPIANGKLPQGMKVSSEVVDVSRFGMEGVRTEHPAP